MTRSELMTAKQHIERARDVLIDLRLEYRPEIYKLDIALDNIEEDIHKQTECCTCGDELYVADADIYLCQGEEMYVCDDCNMDGVGQCECGFPVKDGVAICGNCGQILEE